MLTSVHPFEPVLQELSTEVALLCDRSGVLRWADGRAERLLRIGPGAALTDVAAPGADDKIRRFVDAASEGVTEPWELLLMRDGRALVMTWRGAPAEGGAALVGSLVPEQYALGQEQVAGVLSDFSVLQRETARQRRLLETERTRLQQVLDRLPEAIVIVDAQRRFVVANAAAAVVMGLDLVSQTLPTGDDGAYGARRFDGSPIPARQLPLVRSVLDGEIIRGEQLLIERASDGQSVPLLVNSAPLHDAAGVTTGAVAVFQDISAIKDLERQKDEFLATVSHDLRNPLSGIKGWTQILRRRARRLPDEDREAWTRDLTTVERAATRMGGLIDELMDLTHLQMGRPIELHRRPTDLVELTRRIVADHQQPAQQHVVRVVATREPIEGNWDANRLERIVGNLITNAIKYSPEGGEINVTLGVEQPGAAECAVLAIQDHGIGIPEADLPRIFDRFYRASNVTTRFAGSGIGLAGAKQLVDRHGGSIDVHSTAGVGTTFVVRLPLDDSRVD